MTTSFEANSASRINQERALSADTEGVTAPSPAENETLAEPLERSPYAWFTTLWPLAVIFHLAGNDGFLLNLTGVGVLQIPFLIAAVMMLLRPTPITAAAVAATHILVVASKLPAVGNHEILLLMIHIGVLIAVFTKDKQWLGAVVPPLRWVLLIAYSAIAFSKLNSDFVDRAVSCAVIFGDEFGDWVNVSVSDSAILSNMVIALTIIFELAIPIMLMIRPLRRFGIIVGMVFHTALALEPAGHVFDFTSVLFVLFLLFLTPDASRQVDAAVQRARTALGNQRMLLILAVMAIGNVLMFMTRNRGYLGPTWLFDFPFWLVYAVFLFRAVAPTARTSQPAPKLVFRMAPVMAVLVLLTSLNAVSPYLELRTAGAFNMYSNLTTNNGQTNHFLLPGTMMLGDDPRFFTYSPDAADPIGLDFYEAQGGFAIPEANLVQYVRTYPITAEAEVALWSDGDEELVTTLGELEANYGPTDGLTDRLLYIRAIDTDDSANCRRYWGPAN